MIIDEGATSFDQHAYVLVFDHNQIVISVVHHKQYTHMQVLCTPRNALFLQLVRANKEFKKKLHCVHLKKNFPYIIHSQHNSSRLQSQTVEEETLLESWYADFM